MSTPFTPPSSPAHASPPSLPSSLHGRQRSRTFSQAEADERREREDESERARQGGEHEGGGGEGVITAGELRAEVSWIHSLDAMGRVHPGYEHA